MGLIVPQTVKVRTNSSNYKHYKEKGYIFKKCGDFIEVDVLDLPKGSGTKVKIICDICGKKAEMCYGDVIKCNKENELITCASNFCRNKKYEDTCIKKYGVNNPMQCKEIQDKAKDTNLERYGAENPMQCKEIQDKAKVTNLKKHGAEYPMQNEDIKNKVLDSFQFNGTGPSSKAQRYINHILNGTLNKYICGSLVDIYMEKENIIIEHDGSGHFLGDIINGNIYPTKESLLREKQREDKIISNGYKMIRFIATKDRIPSDEVILNLFEGIKNSDFKVIRIDFEKGIINKDYNEKSYRNFGKLRRITKKDLEKFEKQEENTSEN